MHFQLPKDNPKIKDCCKTPANLEVKETNGAFLKYVCKACQCKHIRLMAGDLKDLKKAN